MKEYFASSLPNLIVPTQFIVGSETCHDGLKRNFVYEIQKKIVFFDIGQVVIEPMAGWTKEKTVEEEKKFGWIEDEEKIAEKIKKSYGKKTPEIKKELETMVEIAKNLVKETGRIPFDIFSSQNLKFTPDGLRIIDTNINREMGDFIEQELENIKMVFEVYLIYWSKVAKLL